MSSTNLYFNFLIVCTPSVPDIKCSALFLFCQDGIIPNSDFPIYEVSNWELAHFGFRTLLNSVQIYGLSVQMAYPMRSLEKIRLLKLEVR